MMRLLIFILLVGWSASASAEKKRFALLIGNQAYSKDVGPLKNPHNDVDLVSASLKQLGFQTTILKDATYRQMDAAIKRHLAKVRRSGSRAISFLYYSGHGVAQPETRINYILPVDLQRADADLWYNSFEQDAIIERIKRQAPKATHYIIFDACRNELNLTDPTAKSIGTGKGFVPIKNKAGVLIAYATAPGRTASDRGEGGGKYAKVLAQELLRPGVEAVTMFRRVQLRVASAINQEPWLNYGTIPEVYLAGRELPEAVAWQAIKESSEIERFQRYIKTYPTSPFAQSARFKIKILQNDSLNKAAAAGWKLIETSSDTAVLEKYIQSFPNHAYAKFARFRIDELHKQAAQKERSDAWNAVRNSTDVARLQGFIELHQGTLFAKLAEDRIALLKQKGRRVRSNLEQAAIAWQQIRDLEDIEPLKDFIATFKDTPFKALAEIRLNKLQRRSPIQERQSSKPVTKWKTEEARGSEKQKQQQKAALTKKVVRPATDTETDPNQAEITLANLTKSLQVELDRVGCSPGSIDGVWGHKSQQAVKLFNKHAGSNLDVLSPTLSALETVRQRNGRVCPSEKRDQPPQSARSKPKSQPDKPAVKQAARRPSKSCVRFPQCMKRCSERGGIENCHWWCNQAAKYEMNLCY